MANHVGLPNPVRWPLICDGDWDGCPFYRTFLQLPVQRRTSKRSLTANVLPTRRPVADPWTTSSESMYALAWAAMCRRMDPLPQNQFFSKVEPAAGWTHARIRAHTQKIKPSKFNRPRLKLSLVRCPAVCPCAEAARMQRRDLATLWSSAWRDPARACCAEGSNVSSHAFSMPRVTITCCAAGLQHKGEHDKQFSAYTVSTSGIQLTEVPCQGPGGQKLPFKSLLLRCATSHRDDDFASIKLL